MLAHSCMPCLSSSTAYAGVCGSEGMTYDPREKTRMKVKSIHTSGFPTTTMLDKCPTIPIYDGGCDW